MTPFWRKTETRKRALVAPSAVEKANPKSAEPRSWSSCWARSGVMAFMRAMVSSGSRILVARSRRPPWRRRTGGRPTERCKSEAPFLMVVSRRRSI